jgi:hypothetical protein
MNQLFTDLRSGVRMLVKYPTLSIVAVLTLGLGIGLSTTVFCVVNGGLFKGLPLPDADRVVAVVGTNPTQNQPRQPISVQDLAIWKQRQTSFDKFGAYGFSPTNLSTEEGRPERFSGGLLTVGAFEALGVQPLYGRGFRDGDDRIGGEPVVLSAMTSGVIDTAARKTSSASPSEPTACSARLSASCLRHSRSRFANRCGHRSRSIRRPGHEARVRTTRSSRG